MNRPERYQFPLTLSNQRRICGLPLDELVLYVPLAICAIFINSWIFAPALAGAIIGIRRLKRGRGSSYLLSLSYWLLPTPVMRFFITALPDSFKRYWIA